MLRLQFNNGQINVERRDDTMMRRGVATLGVLANRRIYTIQSLGVLCHRSSFFFLWLLLVGFVSTQLGIGSSDFGLP